MHVKISFENVCFLCDSMSMTRRKNPHYDYQKLMDALKALPNPMEDIKHGVLIYIEGNARSNQTREQHIIKESHQLKVRDIESIPEGITNYLSYKKDPNNKGTFNYFIKRKGLSKGFIKVSIQIDNKNPKRAWIKTVYITYHIK